MTHSKPVLKYLDDCLFLKDRHLKFGVYDLSGESRGGRGLFTRGETVNSDFGLEKQTFWSVIAFIFLKLFF